MIRSINNSKISKDQEILLRIPAEDKKIEKIIELHEKDINKLKKTIKIEDLEEKLNELVYQLYKIKNKDIKIIKEFLKTF